MKIVKLLKTQIWGNTADTKSCTKGINYELKLTLKRDKNMTRKGG